MEKNSRPSRTPATAASPRAAGNRTTPRLMRTPSTTNASSSASSSSSTFASRLRGLPARVPSTPTTPSVGYKSSSAAGTPSVIIGSGAKRTQKENDYHKPECSHAKLGAQRSRSARDLAAERKEEDTRERDSTGRILTSNYLNVPTPVRMSGGGLRGSVDSKSSTPSRLSSGRTSLPSKRSLGAATPTPTSSRRSRPSRSRVSGHCQLTQGVCVSVTPDVVRKSWSNVCSPDPDVCGERAETTSVSVAVRVRPFNAREKADGEERSILDVSGNTLTLTQDNSTSQSFTYDHCFWSCDERHPQYASQEYVYNTLVVPLLDRAYEGYNVCLFTYGQTGSGKSYTMLGEDALHEPHSASSTSAGVIPRFCANLIQRAHKIHAQNPPQGQLPRTQVEVELSYIEIYNEHIYDLLGGMSSGGGREALKVREDPQSGPYVEGVACHTVSSVDHLMTWLMLGNKERSIAATGLNDKSSRSHAVFTLKLTQTQTEDVEAEELESSKVSVINLVDLAGSERVGASLSQGDRLKEGVCINKSLLTLGKVINSLAESEGRKRPFIPYRESVLTFLLKESLGGNSRTAMIATVSPSVMNIEETRSTLRYAQQTRKIINRNYINEDPTAVIIRSLKREVERLRLQQFAKASSLLFDGEEDLGEEHVLNQSGGGSKEKMLTEKEKDILEKEKEMNQIIEAKEREIVLLREQLRCQQVLNEKTKSLEQRLRDTEKEQQQALKTLQRMGVTERNEEGPVLINLNEDPQLSEQVSYRLKHGTTCIGSSHCDLVLSGLHTDDTHCSIFNDNDQLKLFPRPGAETFINGKLVEGPVKLSHCDRLVLAGTYFFKVSIPNQAGRSALKPKMVDFYFTKEELLKEQEIRLQKEADAALALSKAEMERELERHKQQLLSDMEDAQSQLFEKQKQVCELEGALWKQKKEKCLLEEQLNRDRQFKMSDDSSPESSSHPQSNFLQEVEDVLNESVMEVRKESSSIPPMLTFRIKEANQICRKLRKSYEFMIQEVLSERGLEAVVVAKDLHHNMTATLSFPAFTDMLQVMRGDVKNEDTDVFESSLCWEKAEDVSCVPGFINRLLECPAIQNANLSINSSFNTSSSSIFSFSRARKKSNLHHLSEMSIQESSPQDTFPVCVAAAIHQVLETLPPCHLHTPVISSALKALTDLHEDTQRIKDHTTEPGHTLSNEELSKTLIQLLCHSQAVASAVSAIAATKAVATTHRRDLIQDDIQKNLEKLSSCTSRLFQGVKIETESLVEEASAGLIKLVLLLVQEVARITVLTHLPLPDQPFLKPGPITRKLTDGLNSGLECLVKECEETATKASSRLRGDRSFNSDPLCVAAVSAVTDIADFLKKYATLTVTIDDKPGLSPDDQRLMVVKWIDSIESVAETLSHLNVALVDVVNHTKLSQEGKIHAASTKSTKELLKRLQELLGFAGLGRTSVGGSSVRLLSEPRNNSESMDLLHKEGSHTIKAIEKLDALFKGQNQSLDSSTETPIKYKEKILTQWPRNSDEFQIYLKQNAQPGNSPYKSSFQSSSVHRDDKGKKVRFNVSHTSSVSYKDPL